MRFSFYAARLPCNPNRDSTSTPACYGAPTDPHPVFQMGCPSHIRTLHIRSMYSYHPDYQRRFLSALVLLAFAANVITLFTRLILEPWGQTLAANRNTRAAKKRSCLRSPCPLLLPQDPPERKFLIRTNSILSFCLDLAIFIFSVKRTLLLNRQPRPIPILRTTILDGT